MSNWTGSIAELKLRCIESLIMTMWQEYRWDLGYRVALLTLLALTLLGSTAKVPRPPDPWFCSLFGNCVPKDPGWVPAYEDTPVLISPFKPATPLNPWYFATLDTATETCKRLNCGGIYEQKPCDMGGGPNVCSKPERILKFLTGNKNAGFLAAYWERNPENWYPGVALKLAKADMLK